MAATVKEIRDWLNSLLDDDVVGIDEGGLTLVVSPCSVNYTAHLEIGGMPEQENDND